MNWIQKLFLKLLKITPALERQINIKEPLSFRANVLKNQILYRADPSEIEQFFKQTAFDDVSKARFWAASPHGKVRKLHSGIVQVVVDRLKDLVIADLDSIELATEELNKRWEELAEENTFEDIIGQAVQGALATGDGALKVVIDPDVSKNPILEFYEADVVDYTIKRGRIQEVIFWTVYTKDEKEFRLQEIYGKGYVKYKLFNDKGNEMPLNTLEDTKDLEDVTFAGEFIMAVPVKFFSSTKWKNRGKALFDSKSDNIDALDETISQWMDAIRLSRAIRYIPDDLIPRNLETGALLEPNPFDNQFVKIGSSMTEGEKNKVEVSQPSVAYESYQASYATCLDLTLQGIISPATLGIDLKKTDNADSQREKEKVTLYTRGQIINVLNVIIPKIVDVLLKVQDLIETKTPADYVATVKFGEYASPGFDNVVEVVGKAKSYGVMSTEKAVDELYGDTMTDKEKAAEVELIKAENSFTSYDPTLQNMEADEGGESDEDI
ncbi:MAG: capsid protein [Firmicutes bacterium HGW-Firmicutes-2]|jgi:hypothetical protein|nr:MAG: capsid protein [Firmicutes bacterium HGW-Firmicutes-2]